MEPTSLNMVGYRSWRGGWGFLYVNLLRALRDLLHELPDVNLLQISLPERQEKVSGSQILVEWKFLGKEPEPSILFSISIDNQIVAKNIKGNTFTLEAIPSGKHNLSIEAQNIKTRYPLSSTIIDSVPLSSPIPLRAFVEVFVI